jgi:hypothetical protein
MEHRAIPWSSHGGSHGSILIVSYFTIHCVLILIASSQVFLLAKLTSVPRVLLLLPWFAHGGSHRQNPSIILCFTAPAGSST